MLSDKETHLSGTRDDWKPIADPGLVDSFDDMNLKPELLRGMHANGINLPSSIQRGCIIPILKGCSTMISGPSGSGKTTACCISILQKLDLSVKETQALIIMPYRELAQLTVQDVENLGQSMPDFSCYACVGGTRVKEDIEKLGESPQIIVCTPGRMDNLIKRGALRCDQVCMVCVDEADEILWREQEGFLLDIIKALPEHIQIILNAPTVPSNFLDLVTQVMHEAIWIRHDSSQGAVRVSYSTGGDNTPRVVSTDTINDPAPHENRCGEQDVTDQKTLL